MHYLRNVQWSVLLVPTVQLFCKVCKASRPSCVHDTWLLWNSLHTSRNNDSSFPTYLFTPYSKVLLEELAHFFQLVKFPTIKSNVTVHKPIHKSPSTVPNLSHLDEVRLPTYLFLNFLQNIIFTAMAGVFRVESFPQGSSPNLHMRLSSHSYMLHVSPFSFLSILSPEPNWVRYVDQSALHYVVPPTTLFAYSS